MSDTYAWYTGILARLGGSLLLLAAMFVALLTYNWSLLGYIGGQAPIVNLLGLGRTYPVRMLYHAEQLRDPDAKVRKEAVEDLRTLVVAMDHRYEALLQGDKERGIPAVEIASMRKQLTARREEWQSRVKPLLVETVRMGAKGEAPSELPALRRELESFSEARLTSIDVELDELREETAVGQRVQLAIALAVALVLALVLWISLGLTRRIRSLSGVAGRIAGGDLAAVAAEGGRDEVALLGATFNEMTAKLRAMIETEQQARQQMQQLVDAIRETAGSLSSSAAEILAGTTQQASGAQEHAASVAETVSTVDEVLQTSKQAADRAKKVADIAKQSEEGGQSGLSAVEETIQGMASVKEQVEAMADNILHLAEQAQAIGEIINTVNDFAEQTNLLAVNAAIEAARAAESGRGFAVVASEIKALAEQSKTATAEVRQILGDIQKATNSAVMVTEQGTRSVGAAMGLANRAGETIQLLLGNTKELAQSAAQIAASSNQQMVGMSQIQQAMKEINQVSAQNLAATRQTERAAQDLTALGTKLRDLLAQTAA
ncbi:MAG: methyl-accepting chemotaxis protein [Candidatus Lambdaproteobacteria bacterium]|nr:methyl-accepting chemotaxis protein [Candidatus Lambdaproteobacteria bacterium]